MANWDCGLSAGVDLGVSFPCPAVNDRWEETGIYDGFGIGVTKASVPLSLESYYDCGVHDGIGIGEGKFSVAKPSENQFDVGYHFQLVESPGGPVCDHIRAIPLLTRSIP